MDFFSLFGEKEKSIFLKKKCKVPPSSLALKETLKRVELLSEMLRRARKRLRRRTSHAQRQRERKSSRCSRNSRCRRNHLERRGARESKSAKFDTETDGDFGQSPWGPRKPAEFLFLGGLFTGEADADFAQNAYGILFPQKRLVFLRKHHRLVCAKRLDFVSKASRERRGVRARAWDLAREMGCNERQTPSGSFSSDRALAFFFRIGRTCLRVFKKKKPKLGRWRRN